MENITLVPLDVRGSAYIESCLKQGGAMSQAVLLGVFKEGATYASVPENLDQEEIYSFSRGGFTQSRASYQCLFDFVMQDRLAEINFSVMIEDPWIIKSDITRHPLDDATCFIGETVAYLMDNKHFKIDTLENCIKLSASFLFIGFVFRTTISTGDRNERIISSDAVEAFARECTIIFVSSYDREGLVIWHR